MDRFHSTPGYQKKPQEVFMKVAVLGASGRAGSEITRELASRGHQVTAIARKPEAIPSAEGVTAVQGDAGDPAALPGLIAGSDAVISALHFDVGAATLLGALKQAGVPRLLVTGGAASLTLPDGSRVIDSPDFPEEWKGPAQGGIAFLDALKGESEIDWTFFSPAALIFEGPRTGHYRAGGDALVLDDKGDSKISFADYAIAMVDELEQHKHSRARFTAAY
jgi:putative NADH-flavin reductase